MPAGPTLWGWHSLSERWARKLARHACIQAGDLVLDIGAGTGSITAALVSAGARVVAVELHPGRAARLHALFAGGEVKVVVANAADLRLPRRPFKVVSNPPFSITPLLLRRLVSRGSRMTLAEIVVPRHVAVAWTTGRAPGSRRWTLDFEATLGPRLPRDALYPPAPHDVAVLVLRRRSVAAGHSRGRLPL